MILAKPINHERQHMKKVYMVDGGLEQLLEDYLHNQLTIIIQLFMLSFAPFTSFYSFIWV